MERNGGKKHLAQIFGVSHLNPLSYHTFKILYNFPKLLIPSQSHTTVQRANKKNITERTSKVTQHMLD